MAHVSKIGDQEFVFGLKWELLGLMDGVSVRKEKEAIIKREGTEFGLFYTFADASVLGLTSQAFKGKQSAARAAVQQSKPEEPTIYIIELDKEKSWFVAVAGGAVVPGTDIVDDHDKIQDEIAHFEDYDDFQVLHEISFDKETLARAKDFKVKRLVFHAKPFVIMGVVMLAAWYGYATYQANIAAEKAKKRAEMQRIATMNNTTVEEIEKVDDESLTMRFTTHVDEAKIINSAIRLYAEYGGITNGWSLNQVMCDRVSCYLDYKGMPYARLQDIPDRAASTEGVLAYSLSTSYKTPPAGVKGTTVSRTCKAFRKAVASAGHSKKYVNMNISNPTKHDTGMMAMGQESRLKYGTLSMQGRFFTEAGKLTEAVVAMKSVKITNITITNANTWQITGEFICQE